MWFARLLMIGGAAGLMVALVMPWYGRRRPSGDTGTDIEAYTAFQWFSAADIALLAIALLVIAIVVAIPPLARRASPSAPEAEEAEIGLTAYVAVLTLGTVAVALVLVKLAGPLPEENFVLRYGARFAVVCAGTILIGAIVALRVSIGETLFRLRIRS